MFKEMNAKSLDNQSNPANPDEVVLIKKFYFFKFLHCN